MIRRLLASGIQAVQRLWPWAYYEQGNIYRSNKWTGRVQVFNGWRWMRSSDEALVRYEGTRIPRREAMKSITEIRRLATAR